MKKLIFILTLTILLFAFFSCADGEEIDTGTETFVNTEEETESESVAETETETDEVTETPPPETEPDPTSPRDGSTDDFDYYFNGETICITGFHGKSRNAVIPEEIDGIPVTEIANCIFEHTEVINVTVPGTVKVIPSQFISNYSKVQWVTLSEGVTTICSYAFEAAPALKKITIPESVSVMHIDAINECSALTTINYNGGSDKLSLLINNAQLWQYYFNCEINYYNEYFGTHSVDLDALPLDFWLDREAVTNAKLSLYNSWDDHYTIVEAYAEALYPEYGEATEDGGNSPDLYLCYDPEVYKNGEYNLNISPQFRDVVFENGVKKTFIIYEWESETIYDETGIGVYYPKDILIGIEECVDGVIYNNEYFLNYLKKDRRFENAVLSKMSEPYFTNSEEIITLNMSTIPELEAIIKEYPSYRGYYHTISFSKTEGADIKNAVGGLTVSANNQQHYYSFVIDLTSLKVRDIRKHDTIEDYHNHVNYINFNAGYEKDEQGIYYESDKLKVYRDNEADFYAETDTGEKYLIYNGLSDAEEQAIIDGSEWDEYPIHIFEGIGRVAVYDDRYIIYVKTGWEWVNGTGIFDVETGTHYYNTDVNLLGTRGERVFVGNYHESYQSDYPEMYYIDLSEGVNGNYELHPIKATLSFTSNYWSNFGFSSDGEYVFVSLYDEETKNNKIYISHVDSDTATEYTSSVSLRYAFSTDDYFVFTFDPTYSNYELTQYAALIPIK